MSEPKEEKKDKKRREEGKEKGVRDAKELEGGVKIKDVKAENGPGVQKGESVKMRYVGKPTDGKVFDSNTQGNWSVHPFKRSIFRLRG